MNSTFTTEAPRRGIVTVSIEAADYEKAVKEQLRNIRQRMDMPGFRKGMVPQDRRNQQNGGRQAL